jgi:hypothetical protein
VLKRLSHEFDCDISTEQAKCCLNLKVLFSEMAVVESGIIQRKFFLNGEAPRFLEKSARP